MLLETHKNLKLSIGTAKTFLIDNLIYGFQSIYIQFINPLLQNVEKWPNIL